MALCNAQGYPEAMKWWFLRLVSLLPCAALILIGVANIVSGYVPWLAARIGHAPIWLSVGIIVFGAVGASPSLWLMRLRLRWTNMRRAQAQEP
jgi:hypothetical protein